jgi:cysteine desulfurase/selenocysteine lyase
MIDRVTFEKTTYNTIPFKFEAGTPPIAAGIGLGTAVDYLTGIGMEHIADREAQLLEYATQKMLAIDGLRIIGTAQHKASVISFLVDGIHPTDLGTIIDQEGIAVRTGHHCAQPVMDIYEIPGTARASLSFYNNEEDVDRLVAGIEYAKEFFS